MIKARFLISQDFLGFDIFKKKMKNFISGTNTPKCQNDVIKDKIDLWVFPYNMKGKFF